MIIGLTGFQGSGKGTVGEILNDHYGYQIISFADHLKDICALKFGWPRDLLEGDTTESRFFRETPDPYWSKKLGKDFTPRDAMRIEGTESTRDIIAYDFWVWSAEKKIQSWILDKSHQDDPINFVIPDVRFPNEIDWIKSIGGITVRIIRGEEPDWWDAAVEWNTRPQKDRGMSSYTEMEVTRELEKILKPIHPSEKAWIGTEFDRTIYNNLGKKELTDSVREMILNLTYGPEAIKPLDNSVET
jgi:hypothetical protein